MGPVDSNATYASMSQLPSHDTCDLTLHWEACSTFQLVVVSMLLWSCTAQAGVCARATVGTESGGRLRAGLACHTLITEHRQRICIPQHQTCGGVCSCCGLRLSKS
jgi:hypothetical protein